MDDLQHIGYSREVIEFVAVAKEFCGYLEGSHEEDASELLSKLQKFIPLIYLKGRGGDRRGLQRLARDIKPDTGRE